MSLLHLITLVFLVVVVFSFFGKEFNLTLLLHITHSQNTCFLSPPPPPPPLSPPFSAPLLKKTSVLLGNSKRKKHLEILTCLFALIIFIKRLIYLSYSIYFLAVYKCTCYLRQKESGKQSYILIIYRVK